MLGADLHDRVAREHGVARGLGLRQLVGHRLFAIGVLAGFDRQLQDRRVLEIAGGDDDGVHVLQRQQIFHVLERARRAAVSLHAPWPRPSPD